VDSKNLSKKTRKEKFVTWSESLPAKPVALICEPLKAAETALSGLESELGSVPLSVSRLSAIPELDCGPDIRGLGIVDKSVVKRETKWRSIPIDSRVCQTFAAPSAEARDLPKD
jgi:hypothetical protein